MSTAQIALIVCGVLILLIVVVVVYRMIKARQKKQPMLISRPKLISNVAPIGGDLAPLSSTGREFTYNFWIFIRDWDNTLTGKHVLHRGDSGPSNFTIASPSVWLYPKENKLMVRVSTNQQEPSSDYDGATYFKYEKAAGNYTNVNPNVPAHTSGASNIWNSDYSCDIDNIPLQRWVQVSITMWNRTLDVYINGKLARSCILPGVPAHDPRMLNKLYVGGDRRQAKTFNGYISRLKYLDRAATASDILAMYRKGPLPANWWWQSFKNRMKVILEIDSDA